MKILKSFCLAFILTMLNFKTTVDAAPKADAEAEADADALDTINVNIILEGAKDSPPPATTILPRQPPPTTTTTTSPPTTNTTTGCVKEDIAYLGNDIPGKNSVSGEIVRNMTEDECISWCGETIECEFWTWTWLSTRIGGAKAGSCYLKTSDSGRNEADIEPSFLGSISGNRACATDIVKIEVCGPDVLLNGTIDFTEPSICEQFRWDWLTVYPEKCGSVFPRVEKNCSISKVSAHYQIFSDGENTYCTPFNPATPIIVGSTEKKFKVFIEGPIDVGRACDVQPIF